ncbi:TIGR03619 family F420-dependent LLM class oxidoreductase [Streptomyces sp. NPDC005890]|uniref:TIGR03619 family F420-dependent LLM class oxidoreductase n=1 Tax=Streptomyces sp. NPDC005890 TaxID=3154568 RepID=UPI0033CA1B63
MFHEGGSSAPRNVGNRLLDSGFGLDTDPLVLPAAVSGATTRLRLLTSVLLAPYYPALVLANQAATLDVVSGGRLVPGVGTGWNPDEFAAVGVPARERGARTDDHLAAARALWTRRPADFDGPFTTLRAAHLGVPPVTSGGPPVWVGGHSDAALRRALRFGDGWYGTGVDAAEITDVQRRLRGLAGTADADRLTLATAAFLTPPGLPAAVTAPGRPLGGTAPPWRASRRPHPARRGRRHRRHPVAARRHRGGATAASALWRESRSGERERYRSGERRYGTSGTPARVVVAVRAVHQRARCRGDPFC